MPFTFGIRYYNESLWEEMWLLSCICITISTEKKEHNDGLVSEFTLNNCIQMFTIKNDIHRRISVDRKYDI